MRSLPASRSAPRTFRCVLTEMPQASSCARDHCCCSTGGDSPRSQMWYPLLASTLLVVDEEFFHKNAWAFLRTVYKLFKVSVASSPKGHFESLPKRSYDIDCALECAGQIDEASRLGGDQVHSRCLLFQVRISGF